MDVNWEKLSSDEKLERRFAAWLSAEGLQFATPEAEAAYKLRVTRLIDAAQLKTSPNRVPCVPQIGLFPAYYAGYTTQEVMYDADKTIAAWTKCNLDLEPDARFAINMYPAQALDILDYKLFNWPGHGVSADAGYQFVEGEYMKAAEYDILMRDSTDFWWRSYLPRIMGSLQPLTMLPLPSYYPSATGIPANLSRYGLPEVRSALEKLVEAGQVALSWQQKLFFADRKLEELGFPGFVGGSTEAPFDIIGDGLRGTREVVLDMFRRPAKLLEALEWVTPYMIRMGLSAARMGGCPVVMIPLHKGADGFMSDEQFKTFYWPTLRKVIVGLAEEGLVVRLFAEGGYNSRLEVIRDVPKGKTIWHFDHTDMARAKEVLGDVACIMGNVPASLLQAGTPEETVAYCRRLIDTVGEGGGFILGTGAVIDRAKPENIQAMVRCAREYGVLGKV